MADFRGSLAETQRGDESYQFYQARLFSMQLELFKRMAGENWRNASADMKKTEAKKISKFKDLRKVLNKEIANFSRTDFTRIDYRIDQRIVSLTLFMHLLDLVEKLHKGVMKQNQVGLYEIFDCMSSQIYVLLAADYFRRPYDVILRSYTQLEPAIAACADLAGVRMITIQQAVRQYQPKLSQKVDKLIGSRKKPERKAKMEPKKAKAKKKTKKKPKRAKKKPKKKSRKKQKKK